MAGDREHDVRRAAYAIWEAEGRPEGRDLEHWELARRMLDVGPGTPAAPAKKAARKPAQSRKTASKPAARKNGEARPL